jgi:hypothetical protein
MEPGARSWEKKREYRTRKKPSVGKRRREE